MKKYKLISVAELERLLSEAYENGLRDAERKTGSKNKAEFEIDGKKVEMRATVWEKAQNT